MLQVPSYIDRSGIVGLPIQYKWKSHLHMTLADKAPKNIQTVIQSISCNATFSLSLGIGEWLIWRLHGISNRVVATNCYVEALWASSVDDRYLKVQIPPQPKDQSDPATGPLYGIEAKLFRAATNASLNHPERAKATAGVVSIVRYTLPDTTAFDDWLKTTLARFGHAFSYDNDIPKGVIVPRKWLDPGVPLDVTAIPELLDRQLHDMDYEQNPFLASPTELKAAGFQGEPYRYPS